MSKIIMNDNICSVCQDFFATNVVKIISEDKMVVHYLCDEHYNQIDDPKKLLDLLELGLTTEEFLMQEIFPN